MSFLEIQSPGVGGKGGGIAQKWDYLIEPGLGSQARRQAAVLCTRRCRGPSDPMMISVKFMRSLMEAGIGNFRLGPFVVVMSN